MTVSQLGALIDSALRDHLPRRVRVVGEISGLNQRTHWYFNLKDAGALVNCVMFASAARAAGFTPESGQEVVAAGRVEFYAKQGRTQFYVEKIEPVGAGAWDAELKRLCERARALGWLAPDRKRPLPAFPRRIAVITSKTGAALQDVLDTMRRRCPSVAVALVDVRVQGDGAASSIARAVTRVGAGHAALGIDAILITRGGGSKEDLWPFNDFQLAGAIVACPIPVVAAIGHETDTTLAELVADERCATPTQAAMRLTPDGEALTEQIGSLNARLASMMRRDLRQRRHRLESAARHPLFQDPASIILGAGARLRHSDRLLHNVVRGRTRAAASRLDRLSVRLDAHRPESLYARRHYLLLRARTGLVAAIRGALARADLADGSRRLMTAWNHSVERSAAILDSHERAIQLVGPAAVFNRGYSCTLLPDGAAVRSVADAKPGNRVRTVVADGVFDSVVGPDDPGGAPVPREALRRAAAAPRSRAARRTSSPPDQMDLFGGGV